MLAPWRLGAVALAVASAIAQAQKPPAGPTGVGLNRYVAKALADWEAPGLAIAVVRNDSVIFAKGFGVREIGKPDPVTPNTVFAIGSASKAFTVGLLGMLVDEKRIAWDDRVTKYLPSFELFDSYATRDLTIRDLLTASRAATGSGPTRGTAAPRCCDGSGSWSRVGRSSRAMATKTSCSLPLGPWLSRWNPNRGTTLSPSESSGPSA